LYTQSSNYLRRGDILVTARRGHTVVVLSNGAKVTSAKRKAYTGTFPSLITHKDGLQYIEKGDTGKQVTRLQHFLNWYGGYGLTVDGIFGAKTAAAVKDFQRDNGLTVDGVFGVKSLAKAKTIKK
jgi:peptidoglycan hydrolase-like protein with peptidoglycan-binding domain